MTDKAFDIVLVGATGFTGRLVAEYLIKKGDGLRWAIAGRSKTKLEALKAELPGLSDVEIIVADNHDRASLDAMVKQTNVVCTTVGPYAAHGTELVASCVEHGVHCCDLTGEVHFMHASIRKFDEEAKKTGARIVHACGFDSIPSDIGCWSLHKYFEGQGKKLTEARYYCGHLKAGPSGGTIASMIGAMEAAKDRKVRRVLGDPYSLIPEGAPRGQDGRDQFGTKFDPHLGEWTGPFVMASVNTRVVRRTNALLGFPYGEAFRYSEVAATGKGGKGRWRAMKLAGMLSSLVAGISVPVIRNRMVGTVLPKPGEGPSKAAREAGAFKIRMLGFADGERSASAMGIVTGEQDPGYGETSKMLGESAMCLAKDELTSEGGVHTPASAMGDALLARLRAANMTFSVNPY